MSVPRRAVLAAALSLCACRPSPPEPALRFREVSAFAGLVNTHEKLQVHPSLSHLAPQLSLVGAGAAVTDFDEDGWPDVYLHNSARGSRNRLFRNNRDGTFTDAAEAVGLAGLNARTGSFRAVFFDFDNDGAKDLFLTTFGCPRLLRNVRGLFTDVTQSSRFECGQAPAANVIDFDGDGYLDLIVGYRRTRHVDLQDPARYDLMNITPELAGFDPGLILVYRNERGRGFRPVPGNLGIGNRRGFTHAIGVYDLRGTGRPDIYVAMDMAPDKVFFNEGGGRFREGSAALAQRKSLNGMSAEIAEIDDDGRPVVFVTNIFEPERAMNGGNLLWKAFPDGTFQELAGARGVGRCGYAWGAKFADFDNDGLLDLAVANGLISGEPGKDYWPRMAALSSALAPVQLDARRWPAYAGASLFGYEQKCLFHNRGGVFEDVALAAGFEDRSDGRALAAIDHLNDGSVSLVEANQGQPARFWRNERRNGNHWIGFRLIGARGNRDAFGAEVSVRRRGKGVMTRQLQSANGYTGQSDHRLHFGLGPDPAPASASILWPGGFRQELAGLALDRYHTVREPPSGAP